MSEKPLCSVALRLDGKGFGSIVIDGQDLSNSVTSVSVSFRAGRGPAIVNVELVPESVEVDTDAGKVAYTFKAPADA